MAAPTPIALLASALSIAAPERTLDAGEHTPLGFILLAPTGRLLEGISRSDLIRIVDELLRDHTSLRVRHYEESTVAQQCPEGGFACFVDRVARPGETRAEDQRAQQGTPRHLFVLSIVERQGRNRVAAALIDCDVALAAIRAARSDARTTDELEDRIARAAVKANTPAAAVERDRLESFLGTFLDGPARAAFEESGTWEPYGTVAVTIEPRDDRGARAENARLLLELDGRALGEIQRGMTELQHVLPGRREVRVSGAGVVAVNASVTVERQKQTELTLSLFSLDASSVPGDLRTALFWTGIGVGAAGVGLTAYALAKSPDHLYACPPGIEGCNVPAFKAFASTDRTGSFDASANGSIAIAPLGFALFGAGASWALSTWLMKGSEDYPILELVLGAGIFAGTLLISVAADGAPGAGP